MLRRIVSFALSALFAASAALAQQHPNQEKGFSPTKLYQFNDLDSINTFNGNLIVTLPLTQTFRISPLLGYSFMPVYNGNLWDPHDFSEDPNDPQFQLRPCKRCNAGIGWHVSMGRLISPSDPSNGLGDGNPNYIYESPDGRDHEFSGVSLTAPHYAYSKDESRLRLEITDTTRTIEFPDGTKRVFDQVPAGGDEAWRPIEVSDPFGNHILVDYTDSNATHEVWKITEKQGSTTIRTQRLNFNVSAEQSDAGGAAGTTFAQTYLTSITTSAFGGGTATYTFNYTWTTLSRPERDTTGPGTTPGPPVHVFLLTSIDFPHESNQAVESYSMQYQTCNNHCIDTSHLLSLKLPTGGTYAWTYIDATFPLPEPVVETDPHGFTPAVENRQHAVGVSRRILTGINSESPSIWYYTHAVSERELCTDQNDVAWYERRQLASAVAAPDGTTSVSYYPLYTQSFPCSEPDTLWDPTEYGLPFTHWAPLSGSDLLLSTETYAGAPPAGFPTYPATNAASPHLTPPGATLKRTKRVIYSTLVSAGAVLQQESTGRTYLNDDSGTLYTETIRSGADAFGHYRQSSTGGNSGGALYRTALTNYTVPTAALNNITNWLFDTYTEQCATTDASAPQTAYATCSAMSSGKTDVNFAWKQFDFNTTTGFLNSQRTVSHGGAGLGDLLVTFTPAATGDVATESYMGGDNPDGSHRSPDSDSLACSITHQYSNGSLASSKYDGMNFYSVDRDIDANTGLILHDRDTAGIQTAYSYDIAGRITQQSTPGLATITYAYTPAVLNGTLANAYATSTQNGGTAGIRSGKFVFDGFGRVIRELANTSAGGNRGHDTTYDAVGRKATETTMADVDASYPPATETQWVYDFLGRPTQVTAPDGSLTTISYSGSRQVTRTVMIATAPGAQTPSTTTETYDALGRLAAVAEKIGPGNTDTLLASYGHDVADRLISVDLVDGNLTNEHQNRSFEYDWRGFLTGETHPELGITGNGRIDYKAFDARGHARRKTTGAIYGLFDLLYEYDGAERLTRVAHKTASTDDTIQQFSYGDAQQSPPTNSKGKLFTATRTNNVSGGRSFLVKEENRYETDAGLPSKKTTTVSIGGTSIQSLSQTYTYSTLGDLGTLSYPAYTGSPAPLRTSTNVYGNGFLTGVTGYAGSISYLPSGLINVVSHADGTVDTYSADPSGMARPSRIKFTNFTCSPPTAPTISVGLFTCANSTGNVASVPPDASLTYAWTMTGGTITSGQGTSTIHFSAGPSGPLTLSVAVSNACGGPASATANATITTVPSTPSITAPSSVPSNSTGNAASVPQDGSLTYAWTITGGGIDAGQSTSSIHFTAGASGTVHLGVTISNNCGNASAAKDVTISQPPAAPSAVDAHATGATAVNVSWSPVSGATSYLVLRAANRTADLNGTYTVVASGVTATTINDNSVSANTSYLYRVKAVGPGGTSSGSPFDVATTVLFTDDPAGRIRAVDWTEMRTAVRAFCIAAVIDMTQCTFTDAQPDGVTQAPQTPIRLVHLTDLRRGLNASRSAFGLASVSYAEPVVTANVTLIRHQQLDEIRGGVR